jgi:hypothetical protein
MGSCCSRKIILLLLCKSFIYQSTERVFIVFCYLTTLSFDLINSHLTAINSHQEDQNGSQATYTTKNDVLLDRDKIGSIVQIKYILFVYLVLSQLQNKNNLSSG